MTLRDSVDVICITQAYITYEANKADAIIHLPVVKDVGPPPDSNSLLCDVICQQKKGAALTR